MEREPQKQNDMKPIASSIPSGHVSALPSTLPPAAHGLLSSIYARLAAHHAAMANAPDPAVARLPRPDMAATDAMRGNPIMRRPVIGVPNSPVPNSPY